MNKHPNRHYTNRSNWLRAAVLGANDGILSTTSIVIGIAAASSNRHAVVLAALAGLVAGACSMAAGEYVSVSSHRNRCKLQWHLLLRLFQEAYCRF